MSRYRKFISAVLGLIAAIFVAILPQVPTNDKPTLMLISTAIAAAFVYIAPNTPPNAP